MTLEQRQGRVVGLSICEGRGRVESRSVARLELTTLGLEGDRHFGSTLVAGPRQKGVKKGTVLPNTRQLSLVSVEENAAIAHALGLVALDFTWLAANVLLEGVPQLTALAPGSRLVFSGGAVVILEGENEPCRKVGKVIAARSGLNVETAFVRAALHRRGLVGWVERGGPVCLDEQVTVFSPPGVG
jgi:hypothetical protein